MRAKVVITREAGVVRSPPRRVQGELMMRHEQLPADERTVPVLRLLGHDYALFDPRLMRICAGNMVVAGLERVDGGWHAQEWRCDVYE